MKQKTPKKTRTDIVKKELNPNQRMFCEFYAKPGEYFGNGVVSYILAYKLDIPLVGYKALNDDQQRRYNSACTLANHLLRNVKIKEKCNELLDSLIKDEVVDRELVRVIVQNEELAPKVSAIKEYNLLKKRVSDKPALPSPELHLHLHQSPKVVQIIKTAEDELLKEIQGDIK